MKAKKPAEPEPLLTSEEVAKHLRVTLRTVQRMTAEGEIPAVVNRPALKRYRLSEVMAALASPAPEPVKKLGLRLTR